MKTSAEGCIVLALLDVNGGWLRMADLSDAMVGSGAYPGRSPSVVRASLSRTLRRLWRDGLVELFNSYAYGDGYRHSTMSASRDREVAKLREAERDPEAAFRDYLQLIGQVAQCGVMMDIGYDSADEYIAARRERVQPERRVAIRDFRVKFIEITDSGRERLTAARTTKLTGRVEAA